MSEIETNATVPTPEETAEQPERTFTQAEVDVQNIRTMKH